MTATGDSRWHAGAALMALLTCAATVAAAALDQPALGMLPVLGVVAAWGLWRLPMRYPALLLLLLAGITDKPQDVPYMNAWKSPVQALGKYVFDNLNNVVPVAALRFSVVDATAVLLFGLMAYRLAYRNPVDTRGTVPAPTCMRDGLLVGLAGVGVMLAWGMVRGGDMRQTLWQMRQLALWPLYALLFLYCLRGPRDHRALGTLVAVSACVKALLAFYFYWFICRPQGIKPHYATGHDDTMLFALASAMAVARWHERRDLTGWVLLLGMLPVVMLGMYCNNRRLVWVSLAAALLAVYLMVPWTALKRLVTRALMLLTPVALLYVAAGWSSGSAAFAPVQTLRSMVDADADRSTATRDIENFNLYWTLRSNPLLGTGFGHEYIEQVVADDISAAFPQYRYIPHNSLLALWAFGGVLGFSLLWVPLLLTVFLAARALRYARTPGDRTAALTCVCFVIIYANQAWGDMGIQSWLGALMLSATAAVAAKLAVATGAIPAPRARTTLALAGPPQEGLA